MRDCFKFCGLFRISELYYISSSNSQLTDEVDFTQVYTACIQVGQCFSYSVLIRIVNMLEIPRNWISYHPKCNKNSVSRYRSIYFFQLRKINLFVPFTFFSVKKMPGLRVLFFVKVVYWNLIVYFCKQMCYWNSMYIHIGKIVFPLHCTMGIRG